MKHREIFPRTPLNNVQGTMCTGLMSMFCDTMINFLFGPSDDQRNDVSNEFPLHIVVFLEVQALNPFLDDVANHHLPQSKWSVNRSIFALWPRDATWILWKTNEKTQ